MNDLINAIAALSMLAVLIVQGYMFGYLFTRKLLEYYDVLYGNKACASEFLNEIGYCESFVTADKVIRDFNKISKKWERG